MNEINYHALPSNCEGYRVYTTLSYFVSLTPSPGVPPGPDHELKDEDDVRFLLQLMQNQSSQADSTDVDIGYDWI